MLSGAVVVNRLLKGAILIVSFCAGFAIGSLIKLYHEASTFKPYTWGEHRPIVMNCYDGDFNELHVQRAIDFWMHKGHEVMFYEHNPPPLTCDLDWIQGNIILRKAEKDTLDPSTLAITKRKTSLGRIHSVQIFFQPGSQNLDLLIEHELGHAFGYGHYDVKGHVMHSLYAQMGPMFW